MCILRILGMKKLNHCLEKIMGENIKILLLFYNIKDLGK